MSTEDMNDIDRKTIELIRCRKSCRGFLPDSIPEAILKNIFELAQQSPSNCNTQPWQVAVVSGEACNDLRKIYTDSFNNFNMSMDFSYDGVYTDAHKERQYGAAAALYRAVGIAREDKAARHEQFMQNFSFFNAPHVALLFLPEIFCEREYGAIREAADLGMYAQNLMLSMAAYGVASCPQTALGFFAEQTREYLKLENSWKLLFGISFGYEDKSCVANRCRTERATLDQVVKFFN